MINGVAAFVIIQCLFHEQKRVKRKKKWTNVLICCHGFLLSDKMFPALGFGAQLPPDWKVHTCGLWWIFYVCVLKTNMHEQQGRYSSNAFTAETTWFQTCTSHTQIKLYTFYMHIQTITQLSTDLCCHGAEMKRTKKP